MNVDSTREFDSGETPSLRNKRLLNPQGCLRRTEQTDRQGLHSSEHAGTAQIKEGDVP